MALTIELPADVEARLQEAARAQGQALPAYARALLERQAAAFTGETEAQKDARYLKGYQEQPETPEEVAAIDAAGAAGLAWDPWE